MSQIHIEVGIRVRRYRNWVGPESNGNRADSIIWEEGETGKVKRQIPRATSVAGISVQQNEPGVGGVQPCADMVNWIGWLSN